MNWQIAVGLQVLHRLLARPQGRNLRFQTGNILDLLIKSFDLGLQQLVFFLLPRYLGLKPKKNDSGEQTTGKNRDSQTGIEYILAQFARRLAVR